MRYERRVPTSTFIIEREVKVKISGYSAILVGWIESERGWGIRSNGYSVHISEDVCEEYKKKHIDETIKLFGREAPEIYTRPLSKSKKILIDEDLFAQLRECGSIRFFNDEELRKHVVFGMA